MVRELSGLTATHASRGRCAMPEKLLTDLPADVVGHIVARLAPRSTSRAAPTCKGSVAAQRDPGAGVLERGGDARWARQHGERWRRWTTATSSPGRGTIPSRCGAAISCAPSRRNELVKAVAVLPGGALHQRLGRQDREAVHVRRCPSAPLRWAVTCSASRRCPTACTGGLGSGPNKGEVRLYHVDGTLVHTFTGHSAVWAVTVTPDGQHIISGAGDNLVKVWSVASKSLVSTCAGHWQR